MFNYKESFLNNLEFFSNENKITGGYVYNVDENQEEEFYGGSNNRGVTVPVGLVVNDYDDNIKRVDGEYIGVIGIDRFNEFLDLNHKPLKQITRKFKNVINSNHTKKNKKK
jgi:hypothetical protein